MSIPILVGLAVGEGDLVPLAEASEVAAAAQAAGVTALRLLDSLGGRPAVDPSVVAGYLAGRHGDLGYVVDVPTSHNAPYNTARRVLSLDRAGAGRVGVALRAGGGDEVSDGSARSAPDVPVDERWAEYAEVLTRLWESFPRAALVGDQERAIVVDDTLVRRIDHVSPAYRVAGPLDGPSSVQGRPVLVAADVDVVGWPAVAASADVVVVERPFSRGADDALTAALAVAGRRRDEVALIGRAEVDVVDGDAAALTHELLGWLDADRLDGLELVPGGGARGVLATVRALVPLLDARPTSTTLRAALRLPETAGVPA